MFIKWYRKGGRSHRLDNVFKIELVSTGDVQVYYTLHGKPVNTVFVKGTNFDFLTIEEELKRNEYKTT